jgi:hypothetical protein
VIAALAVAGIAALVVLGYRAWRESRCELSFVPTAGLAVPALELTFFRDRISFVEPSPPPPIQVVWTDGDATTAVGGDAVPGRAVVRYRGAGVGAGFAYVQLGQPARIVLRPPAMLRGRVAEGVLFWCGAVRVPVCRPVVGAEIVVMGGGAHGVDLTTATTDSLGEFEIGGFDAGLDGLGLRVRSTGHVLVDRPLSERHLERGQAPLVVLERAARRRGRLEVPAGTDTSSWRVLARGLPGVEATPELDGVFVLDHVPRTLEARLVVHGLPPLLAQEPARTKIGSTAVVRVVPGAIVTGRVLDGANWLPVPGALVFVGDHEAVRTDDDGCYRLERILPGDVDVHAQHERRAANGRRDVRHGDRKATLEPGATHEGIDVLLTTK